MRPSLILPAGFRVKPTTNVYPAVGELDSVPARQVIHDAFEDHITRAPGVERIGEAVSGRILPSPAARVAVDRADIFACCGALFAHFAPEAVTALTRGSAHLWPPASAAAEPWVLRRHLRSDSRRAVSPPGVETQVRGRRCRYRTTGPDACLGLSTTEDGVS